MTTKSNFYFAIWWMLAWGVALSDKPGWRPILGAIFNSVALCFFFQSTPSGSEDGGG